MSCTSFWSKWMSTRELATTSKVRGSSSFWMSPSTMVRPGVGGAGGGGQPEAEDLEAHEDQEGGVGTDVEVARREVVAELAQTEEQDRAAEGAEHLHRVEREDQSEHLLAVASRVGIPVEL